jgi:hypothetical protein
VCLPPQNLPKNLSEDELRALFSPYGAVIECRVLHSGTARTDSGTGAGALIRMATVDEAAQAIAHLHNQRLAGSLMPLVVRFADTQVWCRGCPAPCWTLSCTPAWALMRCVRPAPAICPICIVRLAVQTRKIAVWDRCPFRAKISNNPWHTYPTQAHVSNECSQIYHPAAALHTSLNPA